MTIWINRALRLHVYQRVFLFIYLAHHHDCCLSDCSVTVSTGTQCGDLVPLVLSLYPPPDILIHL